MKCCTHLILLVCTALLLGAAPRAARGAPDRLAGSGGDDGPGIGLVGAPGARIRGAYVDGTLAYLIEGTRLTILDISDPDAALVRSRTPLPGLADRVSASGGFVYLFREAECWVYDARDPGRPRLVNQQFQERYAFQERIVGNLLFQANPSGLQLWDIQNPLALRLLAVIPVDTAFEVSGSLVYGIQRGTSALQIWDVSNPRAPVLRGRSQVSASPREFSDYSLALHNSRLYVSFSQYEWRRLFMRLDTFDVSSPSAPSLIANIKLDVNELGVVDGKLVTVFNGQLRVYDIHDALNPTLVFSQALGAASFQVVGRRLYARSPGWMQIVDLSSLSAPVSRSLYQIARVPSPLDEVRLVGDRLFLIAPNEVQLVDVSDPLSPALQGSIPTLAFRPAEIDPTGDRLLAPGAEGLRLIDASDPLSPTVAAVFAAGQVGQIVANLAYITTDRGLQIFDIGDLSRPQLLGSVDLPFQTPNIQRVLVAGGRAYIGTIFSASCAGCAENRIDLQIVDIQEPRQPRAGGQVEFTFTDLSFSLSVQGSALFLASSDLRIFDVSNIDAPVPGRVLFFNEKLRSFQIVGTLAYATSDYGLTTFDLSEDPLLPRMVSRSHLPYWGAADISIGSRVAYAVVDSALQVFDMRDPASPLPRLKYPALVRDVAGSDSYAYLAMGQDGFQILRVHPERFPQPVLLPLVVRN